MESSAAHGDLPDMRRAVGGGLIACLVPTYRRRRDDYA
jgi:hypothetical protein